jgi:hypothetical protein
VLYPNISRVGVEINKQATSKLEYAIGSENVYNGSTIDFSCEAVFDVPMTKGGFNTHKPKGSA